MAERKPSQAKAEIQVLEQRAEAVEHRLRVVERKLAKVADVGVPRARGSRESETLLLMRALEVFGDSQNAQRWMQQPNPALSNQTPLRALQSVGGRTEVLNILGRIEHGVIS